MAHNAGSEGAVDLERRSQGGQEHAAGGDPRTPVTIAYIAESAGVSVPTVSKVLNGKSGVSAEKRALIEELINRHGYRKPAGSNRSNVVELVFRELESMWAVEIIRGVERAARKHRVGVMVSEFGLHDAAPGWDDTVSRRPNCVLSVAQLSAAERAELTAKGIPFVVFDPTTELPDGVPFVGATNWSGGRAAARHLVELGHRRIAMIAGPDFVLCCAARLDGYRSALSAAGLPTDPQLIVFGRPDSRRRRSGGANAACAAGTADGDLRVERPSGTRGVPGGSGSRPAHSRRSERRRVR